MSSECRPHPSSKGSVSTVTCAIDLPPNNHLHLHSTKDLVAATKIIEFTSAKQQKAAITSTSYSTTIALRPDITLLSVASNNGPVSTLFFQDLFDLIARYAIPIILTTTSIVNVTLALPASSKLNALLGELESLSLGSVTVEPAYAILSVVGEKMWDDAGLIGRCCNAISAVDVNIKMISQGAAKGSISIVMIQAEGEKAARALHEELFESKGKGSAARSTVDRGRERNDGSIS